MQKIPALYGVIGVSVALAAIPAGAQSGPDLLEQLKIMRQQLEEQRARVDELERQLRASGVAPPANTATSRRIRRKLGPRRIRPPCSSRRGNSAFSGGFRREYVCIWIANVWSPTTSLRSGNPADGLQAAGNE